MKFFWYLIVFASGLLCVASALRFVEMLLFQLKGAEPTTLIIQPLMALIFGRLAVRYLRKARQLGAREESNPPR